MAAATEDRGVFVNELPSSITHSAGLASGETIYENTLVEVNGSGNLQSLDHSAGDDDSSGVVPLAALSFYDEDLPYQDHTDFDRGSTSPTAEAYSDVLLELDNDDNDLSGYTNLETTVYAVDDSTVTSTQSDGSAGNYAPVGTVYDQNETDDTVIVLVEGIRQ